MNKKIKWLRYLIAAVLLVLLCAGSGMAADKSMLVAVQQGFFDLFTFRHFSMMMVGTLIGLVLGVIPGIGGYVGLALLLPFVLYMDPVSALACILSMHSVVTTGGSVTSVLFGVPGTGQNIATCFDGYPMTKKGQGARAVGAVLTASVLGGLVGAFVLIALIPVIRPLVLLFGTSEFFMLVMVGITGVIFMASDSPVQGIVMASLGFLFSIVGQDQITGANRFVFGQNYLWDGLKLNSVVLGQVGISEMMAMAVKGGKIAPDLGNTRLVWGELFTGIKDVFIHWGLFLRSSIIGIIVGIIPGLGGDAAALIAYGAAKQSSRHPELYGTGIVEGVIAPDSACNSKEGGVLLPTLAFGVPGSGVMAILLGVFIIMGINPGREMLNENLSLTFSMAWTVALSNVIGGLIMFVTASYMIRLTRLPAAILMPLITTFILIGSYSSTYYIGDLMTSFVTGLLGYYAWKKCKYPLAPFILAFVLGKLTERSFRLTLDINGPLFFMRPISMALLVVVILLVVLPMWHASRIKKRPDYVKPEKQAKHIPEAKVVSIVLFAVFAVFLLSLIKIPEPSARIFPLIVGIPALILLTRLIMSQFNIMIKKNAAGKQSGLGEEAISTEAALAPVSETRKEMLLWTWFAATIGLVWLTGFLVAIPFSAVSVSRLIFRRGWREALLLAAGLWLIAFLVFYLGLNLPVGRGLLININ